MRIHNVVALIVGSALMNVAVAACYSHKSGGGTSSAFADGSGGGSDTVPPSEVHQIECWELPFTAELDLTGKTKAQLAGVKVLMVRSDDSSVQEAAHFDGAVLKLTCNSIAGDTGAYALVVVP